MNAALDMVNEAAGLEIPFRAKAKPLSELRSFSDDRSNELLRHRFLNRGGGMLLVGPTGIGKSTFSMNAMVNWALNRSFMGIEPSGALRSLIIQAENDEGDMREMRDGVYTALNLSDDDRDEVGAAILVSEECVHTSGEFFEKVVRPLVEDHRPDLLWIDPALAFLGGESSQQKDVSAFLRNGLNPILKEFNCGGIVVHHTNKPKVGKEKADFKAGDFAYLGNGSAEWANWARAVLAIKSIGERDVYALDAAKRGGRLRWSNDKGERIFERFIGYGGRDGLPAWVEVEYDKGTDTRKDIDPDELIHLLDGNKPMLKEKFIRKIQTKGCGEKKARSFLAELLADDKLFEHKIKRPGTNAQKWICRKPQELFEEGAE